MKIEYIIYGVYVLSILNIIMFLILLINKIINNKQKERDDDNRNHYKRVIEGILENKIKGVPKPNTAREISIFKSVLLEAFDRNDKNQRGKLSDIARESGLVKVEIEHLNNSQELRKAIAAYCLGEIRAKEATEELLANINTKDREILYVMCRALVQVSGTKYLDRIINILGDNDFIMKPRILDLISLIDEEDIYPKMKEYLDGENLFKKALAMEVLSDKNDNRIVSYVKEAIESSEKELKISGLKSILQINCSDYKNIIPTIAALKDDEDWEVRAFLAKVMSKCSDYYKESVIILKKMMEDTNWYVRFNSSEGLLNLGEIGIVALSDMLYSSDKFARDRAWSILQRELTLYQLMDRIKNYNSYNYILNNIYNYESSIKVGVLVES